MEIKPPSQPLQNTVSPPSPQPFQKRSHPTQPLHSMVKPAQAHPKPTRKLPSAPSKHGQTHPSPVKAWSKPPQSHPTFKTRSNPPHPPAPLLNRSNPPESIQNTVKRTPIHSKHGQTQPNPPQTHAEPTPNPPAILSPFKTRSNPLQTHAHNPVAGDVARPQNLLLHWAHGNLKRACNTLKYLCCSKPKPAKKIFILQCLANDSAQPQKTLTPHWSTPELEA